MKRSIATFCGSFLVAFVATVFVATTLGGCAQPSTGADDPAGDNGDNPFLADQTPSGKADTAYQNPDGIEVEVDIEADIDGVSAYRITRAPAEIGQFVLTYLRKRGEFYLESLAEDATSRTRGEWLVDGNWITAADAAAIDPAKLTHFRLRAVNAVMLHDLVADAVEGKVYTAVVPLRPSSVMADAGDTCADPDNHMTLDQSIYWYMWNPERAGCRAKTQEAKVTLAKIMPRGRVTYPEYDRLVADGQLSVVVLFGQIGDGAISDNDPGMRGIKQMGRWLSSAKFRELTPAPLGRRFTKKIGEVEVVMDLYSPHEFSGLGDFGHFANFQKALSEHEIVVYDGHSMLGASDFWAKPKYPEFYQIFLYGGCLGYEYYVRPILDGKKGWENVDILSSVVEVSASANEFAAPALAKIFWALDNNYAASWRDILVEVRKSVGDSTFGVSGVRDNCFSPGGSLCGGGGGGGEPGTSRRYQNATVAAIPDNDEAGVSSVIEVPDSFAVGAVTVELKVKHTFVGDLRIVLEHDGTEVVLWDHAGSSQVDIDESFTVDVFGGKGAAGKWTLRLADNASQDVGSLSSWAIAIQPQ